MAMKPVSGFSKLSKEAKLEWLCSHTADPEKTYELLSGYWHRDEAAQKLHDEFAENTISNFYLPYSIAPNFLIDDKLYAIPMAIEESSVVAAAAKAANFWLKRGGFKTKIISTTKIGHVHFAYYGDWEKLLAFFNEIKQRFFDDTAAVTKNMRARGGGILDIQ